MTRRWVRAALVTILLAVMAGAGYQVVITERAVQEDRQQERAFTGFAWQIAVSLADLRAAQRAYVAAGQDSSYWIGQVSSLLNAVTRALASLRQISMAPETTAALDQAAAVIDALRQMDGLVRDHSAAGQQLMASDLIFTDGLELATTANEHIEAARMSEQVARDRITAEERRSQLLALAAATGTSLFVALLLLPVGREPAPVAAPEGTEAVAPTIAEGRSEAGDDRLMLADLDLAVDSQTDRLARAEGEEAQGAAPAATHEARAAPDLRLAAELCTELGRLTSTAELPTLLGRAASLLNASGLIIWVRADESLRPAVGHGYSTTTLARMGPISRDDDNAVAAAFRNGHVQTVAGDARANGAVAIPLLSCATCVGVMSAELRDGWEQSDAVRATASILAAQLATLMAAPAEPRATRARSHAGA
jgi:hypothetical protein